MKLLLAAALAVIVVAILRRERDTASWTLGSGWDYREWEAADSV